MFACYDTANDALWSLATANNIHRVTHWHNAGLGNQHFSPLQPISHVTLESVSAEALLSQPDYALSNSFDEKAQVSLERACYILLYHVDLFARRLSEKSAALKAQHTHGTEWTVSMREHFSLQASKEVFVQLHALLALCTELCKTKPAPLFKYALLVTLRTLRLNIEHVLLSKLELGEFGLGKGKHAQTRTADTNTVQKEHWRATSRSGCWSCWPCRSTRSSITRRGSRCRPRVRSCS